MLIDQPLVLGVALLLMLVACVEIGGRLSRRGAAHLNEDLHEEVIRNRDEMAILLSLLLGFTLAMVLSRFDLRRQLVVEEANAIETTSLRAAMLPEPNCAEIQNLLRQYVDARLDFSKAGLNNEGVQAALTRAEQIQMALWQQSKAVAEQRPTPITSLYVQSLNEVIDLNERRLAAQENRVPGEIWAMLILLSALTCMLVGYCQRQRIVLMMFVTPLMISIVMTLIADLGTPSSGLIHVGQQSLERVRADLNESSPIPRRTLNDSIPQLHRSRALAGKKG